MSGNRPVPSAVMRAVNIADLQRMAKRRLPRILFDYIEGGAGDESGLRHNVAAFAAHRLRPRYLVDVTERSLATRLWQWRFAAPFGIAPVGLVGLFRANGELALAQAARDAGVPYILSGASIATIEDVARVAPEHAWYQIYPARESRISLDLLRRASQSGLGALVLTVDLPVPAKRERDVRNGFDFAIGLSPSLLVDALAHPRWALEYLAQGALPAFGNWAPYAAPGASARQVAEFLVSQSYATQTWRDVELYRREWPGRLILKGIQHDEDARRAADLGVDGLIVSNHGGRQLQCLPAAIEVLPAIRAAVGDRLAIMVDGGIRRGSDIAIALCLGADFVFVGRAPTYGVAAGGLAGARRALDILRDELDLTMGQLGITATEQLRPELLEPAPAATPAGMRPR
jgi:L-lactate dehydrogenase (cytochrome)/(S)-mandelate dehydrogenase